MESVEDCVTAYIKQDRNPDVQVWWLKKVLFGI